MSMRIFFIYFLAAALSLLLSGCAKELPQPPAAPNSATASRLLLHTVVTLQAEGGQAEVAVSSALQRLAELEALTDPHRPGSEVYKINSLAGRAAVKVSPPVFRMLAVAKELATLTEGAFVPTLLPVSQLYGFGSNSPRVPTEEELQQALSRTDWQCLQLDEVRQTARLTEAGMALDLGAAVKGLAADEVRRIFQEQGVTRGLCSFGRSTVLAWGSKEADVPWQIGLQHPRQPGRLAGTLALNKQILSVSGDYERYFEQDGLRYHHLLSPRDGKPARLLQSAAVVIDLDQPDAGLWSDMLSTAFFVLGQEKTESLAKRLPVKVRYLLIDKDGRQLGPLP